MSFGLCVLLVTAVYAAGLSRELTQPWVGMHDWNGAFFSQLARNLLRYPLSLHQGMPIVAVGESVPPPEERSIYATHPPGLTWLVAGAFAVLGEGEWVARLVPIAASLGTLWLLIWLIDRGIGRRTAVLAGLTYSVMPMSVYFGRMVDHEAICLFCMLAALCAWRFIRRRDLSARARQGAWTLWVLSITCAIWVDWSGVLFACVFCGYAVIERRRGMVRGRTLAVVCAVVVIATAAMVTYLVEAGLAGSWADLIAIFNSRTTGSRGEPEWSGDAALSRQWTYTVENLTWPIAALFVIGLLLRSRVGRSKRPESSNYGGTEFDHGLGAVLVTALLWVCVLWRQYERHNYWLFYLGPAAAMHTAVAMTRLQIWIDAAFGRGGRFALYASAGVVIVFGLRGVDAYFERIWYPSDAVTAWRRLHDEQSRAGDRVLMLVNPIRREQRGDYHFRNIVPPQFAYYLDRSFDVTPDLPAVREDSSYAVFVLPVADAVRLGGRLAPLQARFPNKQVGDQVIFTLKEGGSEQAMKDGTP